MLSPGQGLLRVEALALWHLVGHPPQDTHLYKTDSTFCAKFMIMMAISACGHYFLSRQPNKALRAWSVNSLASVAARKEV